MGPRHKGHPPVQITPHGEDRIDQTVGLDTLGPLAPGQVGKLRHREERVHFYPTELPSLHPSTLQPAPKRKGERKGSEAQET
jgi:hypothetical protein